MSAKDIHAITTLKRDAAKLISRARKRRSPIVIMQHGEATAVLQDVDSYEQRQQAFMLLKLMAHGERDFETGRTFSHAQARKRLAKVLRELEETG